MSRWRVDKRYGFGAGHFRLAPHPRSVAPRPAAAQAGLRQWRDEWREAGWKASLRSGARVLTVLGLAALLLTAFLAGLAPIPDESDLTVAWLEVEQPEILAELAAPSPRVPELKSHTPEAPPLQPAVVAVAVPPPPEPISPQSVAVLPKPLPPLPVMLEPVELAERLAVQERPAARKPAAPPVALELAQIEPAPVFEPLAPRATAAPPRPTSPRPVVSVAAVTRPADVTLQRMARPVLQSAPALRSKVRPAPRVASPVVKAAWTPPFDESARAQRLVTPAVYDPSATALAGPPPRLALAAVSGRASNAASAALLHRLRPQVSAAPLAARATPEAQLEGVPLSALAACMSDREEDSLKLEVLARVRQPIECSSAAGRYGFVETRNLNAFLMWIQRSPTRGTADRCDELRFAIACLDGVAASGEFL